MGSLYRRGSIWYADLRRHGGTIRSTGCTSKRSAEAWLRRWERELAGDRPTDEAPYTLTDALAYYLAHCTGELAPATKVIYTTKARHLARVIGEVDVSMLSRDVVQGYIDARLEEGAARVTVKKELIPLSRALQVAADRGLWQSDPRVVIPRFRAPYRPRERVLSPEEYRALVRALRPHRRLWVALAVGTGGRHSEVEGITWEGVDLKAGTILLPGTKTERSRRVIPLGNGLRRILKASPTEVRHGVVVLPWGNVRRDLAVACRHAGLEPLTPNDLRRTFGSWLKRAGMDSKAVADLMGHSSTQMVDRVYGHLDQETLERAMGVANVKQSAAHPMDLLDALDGGGTANPRILRDIWWRWVDLNHRHGAYETGGIDT